MTYEPKLGDEVMIRGKVVVAHRDQARVTLEPSGVQVWVTADEIVPVPDAGEAEMRGEVTGPWAVALSEALEKVEKRVAELEASAKVRDVLATMANLASRVQGLEVTVKTVLKEGRERDMQWEAEARRVRQRIARLESVAPEEPDLDPHADWNSSLFMGADGRLKRETKGDVIAAIRDQNNALAERVRAAEKMTETIRDANTVLTRDVQRAEARLDRIGSFMRGRERSLVKDEILRILEDPAHGAHAQAPE